MLSVGDEVGDEAQLGLRALFQPQYFWNSLGPAALRVESVPMGLTLCGDPNPDTQSAQGCICCSRRQIPNTNPRLAGADAEEGAGLSPRPSSPHCHHCGVPGAGERGWVLPPAAPCVSGEAQGCCWDCKTLAFVFEAGFCQRFQGTAVTNSLRTFSFSLKHCISEGPGVCCASKNPSDSSGPWLSRAEILRCRDQPHHPGAAASWQSQPQPHMADGAGRSTPSLL